MPEPLPDQFQRTRLLLGNVSFARIHSARVVVAGMGAVGSYATEALARAGVGWLRLIDFDEIRESNINRQLFALHSTIGRFKSDVARDRVLDINPECKVEGLRVFADLETIPRILDGKPDLLIDAIDAVGPKVLLIQAAVAAGVPVISSMGAALRKDPMAVRVGDISETRLCPLARFIRKRLSQRGIRSGVRCVYSIERVPHVKPPPQEPGATGDFYDRGRQRTPLGSLPTLTGIFGLTIANEAIRLLSGI